MANRFKLNQIKSPKVTRADTAVEPGGGLCPQPSSSEVEAEGS